MFRYLRTRPMARKGFSMIELLVVMFLIAFMLAFLTMVFINSSVQAKITAAHTLIQKLDVALHEYYTTFNAYPPDSGYGLDTGSGTTGGTTMYDAGTLYRYLGVQLTWQKTGENGQLINMGQFGPFIPHFTDKELKQYNDPVWGTSYIVIDPWMVPIGYIGSKGRVLHNRDGVDLFSCGPDRQTASDTTNLDHGWPTGCAHTNTSYDNPSAPVNAADLGYSVLNGCLTQTKKNKLIGNSDSSKNEILDDINNWDPQ